MEAATAPLGDSRKGFSAKPAKKTKRKQDETKRPAPGEQEDDLQSLALRLGLTACLDEQQPAVRPNKRTRSTAGSTCPVCQVDDCRADLSKAKTYHRRHKVCEHHSKAIEVLVRKQMQRFCQQCSKFHPILAFDQGKRSCRWRLDGHNRRRRKMPQEDASSQLSRSGDGENCENQQADACSQSLPVGDQGNNETQRVDAPSRLLLSGIQSYNAARVGHCQLLRPGANSETQLDASSWMLPLGNQENNSMQRVDAASSWLFASDNREYCEHGDWEVANLLVAMSRGLADQCPSSVR